MYVRGVCVYSGAMLVSRQPTEDKIFYTSTLHSQNLELKNSKDTSQDLSLNICTGESS